MKILIADDHHLILSSIKDILSTLPEASICGEYRNGESLIQDLDRIQPDIVLLDYHLPDKTGTEIARYIKYHFPNIKIIILTGFEKAGLLTEVLDSGCSGFLLKSSTNSHSLRDAVLTVYAGKMYIDNHINERIVNQIHSTKNEMVFPKLTKREIDIINEISNGLTSKEIADKLFISKKTVDNHRNSIMLKTNSKNIAGLIKYALERNLINLH